MANLLENINQACADFSNIKKAITDKGVEIASGTPSSEYADKVSEVYDAGKAYAYSNPQTPTDGRECLTYWYAHLNFELGRIWDEYWESESGDTIIPANDEATWLDELEYPSGTSRVTIFDEALTTIAWIEDYFSNEAIGIPTKKFTGVLNMEAATSAHLLYGRGSKVRDAGTVILPKSPNFKTTRYTFGLMYNLTTIRFIGTIQNDFGIWDSPLDGDTIRHIVSILSDSVEGKTLTLNRMAVELAMPWEFWDELIATKKNWTISLV